MQTKQSPAHLSQGANRAHQNHFRGTNYTIPPDVEPLLSRLEGVRRSGHDKWLARCPAHDDRSPSLAVRAVDDRVLVHCFGGCPVGSVLAAVGLGIADLFPKRHGHGFDPASPRKPAPRFLARELLEVAALEARIVALAACDMAQGIALSVDDAARVALAAEVLYSLVQEVAQ